MAAHCFLKSEKKANLNLEKYLWIFRKRMKLRITFQSDGIRPVVLVRFTMYVIGFSNTAPASFSSLAVIASSPVTLDCLILFNSALLFT